MGLPAHIPSRQGQKHCLETLPRYQVHALSDLHGLHLLIYLLLLPLMLLVIQVGTTTINTQGSRILQLALLPRVELRGTHNEKLLEAREALQK